MHGSWDVHWTFMKVMQLKWHQFINKKSLNFLTNKDFLYVCELGPNLYHHGPISYFSNTIFKIIDIWLIILLRNNNSANDGSSVIEFYLIFSLTRQRQNAGYISPYLQIHSSLRDVIWYIYFFFNMKICEIIFWFDKSLPPILSKFHVRPRCNFFQSFRTHPFSLRRNFDAL